MNLLLILLAFAILLSSFAAVVSFSQFEQDLNNFEHLNFGVDQLLQKGRQAGKIVNNLFDITRIYNISSEQSGSKDYYDFGVQLDDSKGSVIQATFRVRIEDGQATSLVSFNYQVTKTTIRTNETDSSTSESNNTIPNVPGKTDSNVSSDQTSNQDPDVQEALDFGVQSVIQTGENQNKIQEGENYQVTKINSVNKSSSNNQVTYEFDVEVANSKGNIVIKMTFTVKKNSDGEMSVTAYNYHVSTTTSGTDDIGPDTVIPPSQYDDPEIREALTFGRDHVLQSGENDGKIKTGESYYMVNVNSIIKETGDNAVRYKFDITMENTKGNIEIQMKYTVNKDSSGQLKVVAFNYSTQTTT